MEKKKIDLDAEAFKKLTAKDERLEKLCQMAGRNRILEVYRLGIKRGKSLKK